MILQIRATLVFLLMLLQLAAPLIHAHTNNVTHFGVSVHLPEFEEVNALPKHAPEFVVFSSQNDDMVTMSSGIKNKAAQIFQTENTIFVLLLSLFFMVKKSESLCCFSFKTEPILRPFFLNFTAPRAPPFFTFR
jgi:hypothetical protein